MITRTFDIQDLPHKRVPLWWQKQGLTYTRTGYGRRIPSELMVQLPESQRWRRVYVCIFSNAGTAYVPDRDGNWTVITGSANR